MIDEQPRLFGRAAVLVLRKYRHEGLRKRTFGKKAPQQIGDFERDEERVRHQPGPERAGDDGVPDESHHSGKQRHAAYGRQCLE